MAGNDQLLIGAVERDSIDANQSTNRLLLWRVDAAGRMIGETELTNPAATSRTNTAAIRDVISVEKGNALLLVDFEAGRPFLVSVDGLGKQTSEKEILPGKRVTLLRILQASKGRLLLIGHESFNALYTAIDASGKPVWEKRDDRGKMDLFVDGLSLGDAGFILVGNTGQYDSLRSGPSTVWVGRYDSEGNLKTETAFPGRYGRIAKASRAGYAVVYDKSATSDVEIELKAFSEELKPLWTAQILKAGPNFADFRVTALPSAGFVVAGSKDGRPFITIVDALGQPTQTFEARPPSARLILETMVWHSTAATRSSWLRREWKSSPKASRGKTCTSDEWAGK